MANSVISRCAFIWLSVTAANLTGRFFFLPKGICEGFSVAAKSSNPLQFFALECVAFRVAEVAAAAAAATPICALV
jgi:hypothetical protein